jgi:hypothetical protein
MTSQYDEEHMVAEYNHACRKARAVIAEHLFQYAADERATLLSDQEPKAFRDQIAVVIEAIDLLREDLLAWARGE